MVKQILPASSSVRLSLSLLSSLFLAQVCKAETWNIVNSGLTTDLQAITWDGSRFVAVDSEGGVLQSANGTTWSRKETASDYLYEILAGGGRYLALGTSSEDVFESTDLQVWTRSKLGNYHDLDFIGAFEGGVYNNGSFILHESQNNAIFKTGSATNWLNVGKLSISQIAYGDGKYVAAGRAGISTSTDAVTWTAAVTLPQGADSPERIAYHEGRFLAVSSEKLFTSLNGGAWTTLPWVAHVIESEDNNYPVSVCGGNSGFKIIYPDGFALSTTDGVNKTVINIQTTGQINDVAFGGGVYVAVGNGGLVRTFSPAAPVPEIAISQPASTNLSDGVSKTNFGNVKIRKKSAAKTYTIKNVGTANLTGLGITKKGKQMKEFVVTGPAKTTLAPGASTTFKVVFSPTAKGVRNASIHIKSNDADESPFDITLKGAGVK